jgi:tungstate transport system ATP-binding protein
LRKVPAEEIKIRARKWMERFGILQLAKRQAGTLSSGEAKRASLARAFVLQPEILFMDEPFGALDGPTHQALIEDFENVLRETKVTTVMVTHDRNEALVLADRVAVMIKGSISQIGIPEEVFSAPIDEQVAAFVEAGNILHGVVDSLGEGIVSIDVGGGKIQAVSVLPPGSRPIVYISYEDVTVSLPSAGTVSSSARNQLRGKITRVFPSGYQVRVTVDCGFPLMAVVTRRSGEELGLDVGKEVVASFKATAVKVLPGKAPGPK